jgi:hypothetical protein
VLHTSNLPTSSQTTAHLEVIKVRLIPLSSRHMEVLVHMGHQVLATVLAMVLRLGLEVGSKVRLRLDTEVLLLLALPILGNILLNNLLMVGIIRGGIQVLEVMVVVIR